jgi:hypothetical protein
MRPNYDFAKMKGHRNPYVKRPKGPITIIGDCKLQDKPSGCKNSNQIIFRFRPNITIQIGKPVIYMWKIQKEKNWKRYGRYVGQAINWPERLGKYLGKINKERLNKSGGLREVHKALRKAIKDGRSVSFNSLKILSGDTLKKDLNRAERDMIEYFNSCGTEPWQLNRKSRKKHE